MWAMGLEKLLVRALPAKKRTSEEAERLLPEFSEYYDIFTLQVPCRKPHNKAICSRAHRRQPPMAFKR
jgi:hypothetical protein